MKALLPASIAAQPRSPRLALLTAWLAGFVMVMAPVAFAATVT